MSRMIHLPGALVRHMQAQRPTRTDEDLQARFGISYNTFRRIEAGEPIRASVAERLTARLAAHVE